MKVSKKLFGVLTLLLFAVLLVACTPDEKDPDPERNIPTFSGVGPVTLVVGDEFNALAGVGAKDHDGKDLTSSITVTENNVDTDVAGNYSVKYSVTDSENLTATATRAVTVNAQANLYANGSFNYRFADSELRHTFFAAAEGYLLNNVAGGVPLFINSGSSIYSSRVSLPVTKYVPVMGWGSAFGTLTADDSTVTFSGGKTGVAGERTYRAAFSSNPTTFNQWLSDDSVSSDAAAYMLDSLYAFLFNDDKTAYVVKESMAAAMPTPVEPETLDSGLVVSNKWVVPVKEGLKWGFHPQTNVTGLATDITAKDFVDTFRFALDNGWFRAIAGGSHFWATSNNVVGSQAYRNFVSSNPNATQAQKDAEWDKVGFKVVNGNSIEFTFASDLSEWNLVYWLSSNTMTPVHLGLLDREGIANYGRTPQQMAFTGPYYLSNFEADKALEYKKNPNFHTPDLYKYDGYYFIIIERAEIIFAEFEAGNLDSAGIPLTKFEQYKSHPGLRRSPGATTFRMTINGFGTKEALQETFPDTEWTPEPILANVNMKRALYYAVDRKTLAWDILKTSDPGQFLFSDAYLVDPLTGTAFRQTPQGQALAANLSPETYGFNPDAATAYFKTAVAESIAAGVLQPGTAANPRVIELDLSIQAASTSQAQMAEFLKNSIESLLVDTVNHIKFDITIDPVTFPDNYYARGLIGRFDLATGGISGSTLDAASFLEVFTSDNRGGFTLDWGFDTSIANIPVTYTTPTGEERVNEIWSFDAITAVLNGPVTVVDGVEVLDTVAIKAVTDAIAALPTVANYVHATDADAVDAAYTLYAGLLPRAQAQVEGVDKLFALLDAYDAAEAAAQLADAVELLEDINSESTSAEVAAALKAYQGLSASLKAQVAATLVAELATQYAVSVNAAIDAIPTVVTTAKADQDSIAAANTAYNNLKALVTAERLAELVLPADYAVITDALNESRVLKVVEAIDALVASIGERAVVLTDRYAIQDVRTAYNALKTQALDLQPEVTNANELFALEAEVKPFVDNEQAYLWTLTVASLPDSNDIRTSHKVQVEIAIKAYNALSNEAKLLVGTEPEAFDVPETLVVLEDIIDALESSGVEGLVEIVPATQPAA
ncbi:ABC transporter substrate-binding protein [Acholeplasma granularum]|uniref:ABC transporter substrate-binding protein n=1 Tax=Acholeplasma granularum TaxID=264635 RepID=UPI000471C0EF|nr:ABC transporter substrate-binding protein [Acholeplasma granularum]